MTVKIVNRKKNILFLAMPDTMLMILAGPFDVFSHANTFVEQQHGKEHGYNIQVISHDSSEVIIGKATIGYYGSKKIKEAVENPDTFLVAGYPAAMENKITPEFLIWVQKTAKKARRIGSVCRGAFLLGQAGLLKGKRATTHWKFCQNFQLRFPDTIVDSDPIYIKDGNIYTSAGVSAGIDLALSMVEEDYGKDIALKVAQDLVLYLRRPGTQSQFSRVLSNTEADHQGIKGLQSWIVQHLQLPLSVEKMAEHCSMSPRNFSRVFQKEMGITPGKYLEKIRVESARRLLEESTLSLDQISEECGLGSADSMRRVFLRHLKSTPSDYRKTFRTSL